MEKKSVLLRPSTMDVRYIQSYINKVADNYRSLVLFCFAYPQSRHSVPDVSILEVDTKKVDQLPLKDFSATTSGRSGQEFGFVMGPACFY